MWIVRILSGKKAGKVYPLKPGVNILGRAPHCNVVIASSSISKEHAKIEVLQDKILISDLKSSNGTFVDGVLVKSHSLKPRQKFSLHNIVMDLIPTQPQISSPMPMMMGPGQGQHPPSPGFQGNTAYNLNPMISEDSQMQMSTNDPDSIEKIAVDQGFNGLVQIVKNYIENVVMPGVYKIPEYFEFRWTIGGFVLGFILFVTLLSSIPMMRILKDSIESESREHALTIAETEAQFNRESITRGVHSTLSVNFARKKIGVEKAYIIDALDGSILAPVNESGGYTDIPFATTAMREGKHNAVKQIDSSTVVALSGIPVFNPETGSNSFAAYAVIVYNMGQLALNNELALSLYIQTLFIAFIVGALLFFFLYRVILYPITHINKQLDEALKDNTINVHSNYQFPELQSLISNINSSLTRASSGGAQDSALDGLKFYDRSQEMVNIVNIIGFPALCIQAAGNTISAVNAGFEERTNQSSNELSFGPIDNILDQALRLNITDLIEQVKQKPDQMASNQLDINGDGFDVTAQAVYGKDEVAYYIIVLLPQDGEYAEGGE